MPPLALHQLPLDRIIENTTRFIQENPDDASGYAQLARVCCLAYVSGATKAIGIFSDPDTKELLRLNDRSNEYPRPLYAPQKPPVPESLTFLLDSIRNYQEALKRAPDNGLYWLGLAYMLEMASQDIYALPEDIKAPIIEKEQLPKDQRACEDKALEAYRTSWSKKANETGPSFHEEAGGGIVHILKKRPDATDAEKWEALRITRIKADWNLGRSRAISPIIFDTAQNRPLRALLAPDRRVPFDLDGSERGFRWSWVAPGTSLLVWDPDRTGRITSGRQLIGNVTWWLFWDTGYRVLATLDDNHDGWLTGRELDSLAVWTDVNGNAVSDPGEVVPIRQAGVEALAATTAGKTDGMPCNLQGIRMKDGRVLPTYDWIANGYPKPR